jgi:hypothetical protein
MKVKGKPLWLNCFAWQNKRCSILLSGLKLKAGAQGSNGCMGMACPA